MQRATLWITLLFVIAAGIQAADVPGTWQAQVPGRDGNLMDTTFQFKVSGGQLTGTVENQFGQREISDGKVSGDDISFTVNIDAGGNQLTFLYKGKVSANEIKFNRERKGGEGGSAKVDFVAKRKN